MKQNMKVILASNSPRRSEIMKLMGLEFDVIVSNVEESTEENDPGNIVCDLALQKAEAVSKLVKEDTVTIIGADTIVVADGRIIGKPRNEENAKEWLRLLSGREHNVYTGVAIVTKSNNRVEHRNFVTKSSISFQTMTEQEIADYVGTGEPMDKAGGYAIQGIGGRYIKGIKGDYFSTVGLPMNELYNKLKELNVISV